MREKQIKRRIKRIVAIGMCVCTFWGGSIGNENRVYAGVNQTDVTTPSESCAFIGIKGDYLGDVKKGINRINEIRREACREGVLNPNTKEPLQMSDYVPIKWSEDLEYIARIRAAEASQTLAHERTNGDSCFSIQAKNGMSSWGEVLAWNNCRSIVYGVNQWYGEKRDWVRQNPNAVTGHYTAMINPRNTFVGLAGFYTDQAVYSNTVSGEFSSDGGIEWNDLDVDSLSQAMKGKERDCTQIMEVRINDLNGLSVTNTVRVGKKQRVKVLYNRSKFSLYKGQWRSSDSSIISVDGNGNITPHRVGRAVIAVDCGDRTMRISIKVRK